MRLLLAITALSVTACASKPIVPREPTRVSLETKKSNAETFNAVSQALVSGGYTIKSMNPEAGLIVTEPKAFNYERGLGRLVFPARTTTQISVAPNQVTLTMTHECGLANIIQGGAIAYQHCNQDDAVEPIKVQEAAILGAIKPAL